MSVMLLGFIMALADALPEPARVAAARTGNAGLYAAGLAGLLAAVTLAAVVIRRRGKERRGPRVKKGGQG